MKFLNKKERVLDIQLTQYGKHLLSKGDFRPIHYAFFDDDVIYDRKYASANKGDGAGTRDSNTWSAEPQNEIEDRIKEDLRFETQYVFSGIEDEITKTIYTHVSPHKTWTDPHIQQTPTKFYNAGSSLGRSNLGINKKSAFSVPAAVP